MNLPGGRKPFSTEQTRKSTQKSSRKRLAIVVTGIKSRRYLDTCLESIKQQTQQPAAVVIVDDRPTDEYPLTVLKQDHRDGWHVIRKKKADPFWAKNAGIEAVFAAGIDPLGFVFLNADDRLQPGFINACLSVFKQCPEVGLVSCWVDLPGSGKRVWMNPCPSFPYQWVSNLAAPFSAVRTAALHEAGSFRSGLTQGYENWDLFNAIMAHGWVAVTIPELLGFHRNENGPGLQPFSDHANWKMFRKILERFPDQVALDVNEIIFLSQCRSERSQHMDNITAQKLISKLKMVARDPRKTIFQVMQKIKGKI